MALYPFWLERATLSIWASGGWRDRGMDSGTLVLFIHTDKPWKKSSVGCVWSCNWTVDVYEHNLIPFGCKRDRENCPDQYLLTPCQYISHSFWDTTPRIIRDLSENAHNVCIVVNVHIHFKKLYIYCIYPKVNNIKAKIDKRVIISVYGHVRYNHLCFGVWTVFRPEKIIPSAINITIYILIKWP